MRDDTMRQPERLSAFGKRDLERLYRGFDGCDIDRLAVPAESGIERTVSIPASYNEIEEKERVSDTTSLHPRGPRVAHVPSATRLAVRESTGRGTQISHPEHTRRRGGERRGER